MPSGNRKVSRASDPLGRVQANGDGQQQIYNHQSQQHKGLLEYEQD
jgi:hypothetical protein